MAKTVDTGTPPESVQQNARLKELILSGEDVEGSREDSVSPHIVKDTVSGTTISSAPSLKRVILRHQLYTLTLQVLDVSIAAHQVAIRLPATGFKFEPTELNSEFEVEYLSKVYKVAYLGGIFDFPGDESWVIAFIRVKTDEQDN